MDLSFGRARDTSGPRCESTALDASDLKIKKIAILTYVFVGLQSAGKSTVIERAMNSVLNVVQQGTGTR
jgi:ribosome-interacting GTPase 1